MKTFLAASLVVVGLSPVLHAQSPTKPITNAELRAKVAALQRDIEGLQRDQRLLMMACQAGPVVPAPMVDTPAAMVAALAAGVSRVAEIEASNQRDREYELQQQRLENAAWYVKDVDFGITESNRVFIRYGWKVTIKNGIPRPQTFDLVVQFLNKEDLVIDSVRLYRQGIAAQDEKTITGDVLISMPGALNVTSVKAMATRHPNAP